MRTFGRTYLNVRPPPYLNPKTLMAIAKVIEIIAEGETVDDALRAAVSEASKTVRNIKSVYVEGFQALVENDAVTAVRLNAKVTFVVG